MVDGQVFVLPALILAMVVLLVFAMWSDGKDGR